MMQSRGAIRCTRLLSHTPTKTAMAAVDPTYPLLPIASILASFMLLLVLLNASIRQQWNFGVALLCFWLLLQNTTGAANTIIWSDNADIRLLVYCDIGSCHRPPTLLIGHSSYSVVSRLQVLMIVLKPMATLIITRRLYLIVTHLSDDVLCSNATVRHT